MAKIGVPYAARTARSRRAVRPQRRRRAKDPRNRLRHGRNVGYDRRRQPAERPPRYRSPYAGRRQPVQTRRRDGLTNQRIVQHDAVEVLRDMIQPASLSGVHLLSRPWPKARHHKRRSDPAAAHRPTCQSPEVRRYIHCATDWENYAEQMLEVLSAEPTLENTADGFRAAPRLPPADQVRAAWYPPRTRRLGRHLPQEGGWLEFYSSRRRPAGSAPRDVTPGQRAHRVGGANRRIVENGVTAAGGDRDVVNRRFPRNLIRRTRLRCSRRLAGR